MVRVEYLQSLAKEMHDLTFMYWIKIIAFQSLLN